MTDASLTMIKFIYGVIPVILTVLITVCSGGCVCPKKTTGFVPKYGNPEKRSN